MPTRHQLRHQLVLGDAESDIAVRVGRWVVRVLRSSEMPHQVLGHGLAGQEFSGASGQGAGIELHGVGLYGRYLSIAPLRYDGVF